MTTCRDAQIQRTPNLSDCEDKGKITSMLGRRTTGSVVCPGCGSLVGVSDEKCYICGRVNPGLWGFAPVLRRLGNDLGFVPLVVGASTVLYVLTLVRSQFEGDLQVMGGLEIDTELRPRAEISTQAQGRLGGDPPLAGENTRDPVGRNPQSQRQRIARHG